MQLEFLNWDSIVLVHLKALDKEEGTLTGEGLVKRDFVPSIVDLGDQILHFIRVERRLTNHHLVQHDTKGPCVNLGTVASLFQQLW